MTRPRTAAEPGGGPEPGFPTDCCTCGNRIYTSRESFQHHTDDLSGEQLAWHIGCSPFAVSGGDR